MPNGRLIAVWLAMTGKCAGDSGCRDCEQRRPLTYGNGMYRGLSDKSPGDQQVQMPSQRTAGQRF
jgi:hypothetical protein